MVIREAYVVDRLLRLEDIFEDYNGSSIFGVEELGYGELEKDLRFMCIALNEKHADRLQEHFGDAAKVMKLTEYDVSMLINSDGDGVVKPPAGAKERYLLQIYFDGKEIHKEFDGCEKLRTSAFKNALFFPTFSSKNNAAVVAYLYDQYSETEDGYEVDAYVLAVGDDDRLMFFEPSEDVGDGQWKSVM